ncbi:glycosyltransferase family 2 protein [Saliphagus sp. LR7]|uniref:glycosyltransferase family 2 protein n=1 Tax=Saliphagus sp. LR7 TaxID=2282654 RepID=UPI000DF7AE76|nr:glycosyltransferase family 2 protein [Saliphagus sp. LR7]
MYRDHTVAVVVPAYDEEGFVGEVLDTVPEFVDRIYAVDDRSTDGTWAEIERHAGRRALAGPASSADREGRIVSIRHDRNRGVGAAIATGYERALEEGIDVVAVMAGDGQMDPEHLDRLLDPIVEGRAGYAKGNRLGGRTDLREMSGWRLFGNALLTGLTRVASGYWGMADPQNGYTAISRAALEDLALDDLYEGYGFTNDVLVALNARGVQVADVAMPARYGEEESGIVYRSFVPGLSRLLLRAFVRRLRSGDSSRPPVGALVAVGALGLAAGFAGSLLEGIAALRGRSPAGRRRAAILLAVVGAWSLLAGLVLDRRDNRGTVVSVR